jgi:hypothetical protein
MRKKGTSGACSLSLPFFVFFRFFRLYALSFFRSFLPEKQDAAALQCSEAISHARDWDCFVAALLAMT